LPDTSPSAQSWKQNLALAATASVGFLLLLEGGLRLWGPHLEVPALEVRHGGNPLLRAFTGAHFVRDPELMWAPRRSYPPFNAEGYRGQPVARPKPPGELRILAVGDSNMLGHTVSWANDLAANLDPRVLGRERTTVVNASVYGYSSNQGRVRLEQFRSFQPDLVLISFGGNDPNLNVATDRELRLSPWQLALDRWSERLRIAALVRYAAFRLARRSEGRSAAVGSRVPRVPVGEYRDNLRTMIERSRQMGARPVLFTRPLAYDEYALQHNGPARPYYLATLDVGAMEKVPVIDLHRMMGFHWSLYQDHSHFNARGYAVAARLVAQALTAVITRGTYDAEVLRYQPTDGPYEQLLDELWGKVSQWPPVARKVNQWMTPSDARSAFLEAVAGRSVRTLYDLASPPAVPAWRLANAGDTLEIAPGRLCVASSSPSPGIILDLPADPGNYLFLWLELDGRTEAGVQLYWDTGAGFSENHTASAVFAGPFDQHPYRFSYLLPTNVAKIRLDIRAMGAARVMCLGRLWIERVGASVTAAPNHHPVR
jgi:lysophospholipase L1-like esterase